MRKSLKPIKYVVNEAVVVAHFDEAINTLSLIPVSEPEFDLILDVHLVHSYRESGRAPRVADSRPAARQFQVQRLGPSSAWPTWIRVPSVLTDRPTARPGRRIPRRLRRIV